jgi:PAS domain S-box-containing protein
VQPRATAQATPEGDTPHSHFDTANRYEALFSGCLDAVYVHDFCGQFLDANDTALNLLGYERDDIASLSFADLLEPHDLPKALQTAIDFVNTGESAKVQEYELRRRDGTTVWVEVNASIIRHEGESIAILGIARDLTERRQAEQERKNLERQLQHSQKLQALGVLSTGIAHDVNNTLMGIAGCADIALTKLHSSHPAWPLVSSIRSSAHQGSSVSKRLLRFGSQASDAEIPVSNSNDVLSRCKEMLLGVVGTNIEIGVTTVATSTNIACSEGELEQVIVNLVLNAKDAMSDGGLVSISTSDVVRGKADWPRHSGLENDSYLRLSVTDTGIGMSEETKTRMFDPFFTTRQAGTGTGLGLSVVYGFVQAVKGHIEVVTELGRGSCISIYIPIADEAYPSDSPGPISSHGNHATVMVVDDEPLVRMSVKSYLEDGGYLVLEAATGVEAIDTARGHGAAIDLLVTDVSLPDITGLDVAKTLASFSPQIPVLYISGHLALSPELPADIPYNDVLSKPFGREMLLARVRQKLDLSIGSLS